MKQESPFFRYEECQDAVEAKKQNGWKSEKKPKTGDWIDICPDCLKEGK